MNETRATCMYSIRMLDQLVAEPKITGGHWPFSMHFSKMANQSIKQDTVQMANQIHTEMTKWPINISVVDL